MDCRFLNTKGSALILVLIIITVFTLLGMALWQYSFNNLNHAVMEEKRIQAYFLARSGAEIVADYLVNNPDFNNIHNLKSERYSVNQINNAYLTIEISSVDNKTLIVSTGEVDEHCVTLSLEIYDNSSRYWISNTN